MARLIRAIFVRLDAAPTYTSAGSATSRVCATIAGRMSSNSRMMPSTKAFASATRPSRANVSRFAQRSDSASAPIDALDDFNV